MFISCKARSAPEGMTFTSLRYFFQPTVEACSQVRTTLSSFLMHAAKPRDTAAPTPSNAILERSYVYSLLSAAVPGMLLA